MIVQLNQRLKNWFERALPDNDVDGYYFDTILNPKDGQGFSSDDQVGQGYYGSNPGVRTCTTHSDINDVNSRYQDSSPRITTTRGVSVASGDLLVAPKPVNKVGSSQDESDDNLELINHLDLTAQAPLDGEDMSPHVLDLQS